MFYWSGRSSRRNQPRNIMSNDAGIYLYDYDTATRLSADDLDVSEETYASAIHESLHDAYNASGVVRVGDRRVYAA
jgi:hypothetical protein